MRLSVARLLLSLGPPFSEERATQGGKARGVGVYPALVDAEHSTAPVYIIQNGIKSDCRGILDSGIGAVRMVSHVHARHRHVDGCWTFDKAAAV